MKKVSNINEFWGAVIRRDMSSAIREEEIPHSKEELQDYLKKEIERQGKNVVICNLDVSDIEDLSNLFLIDDKYTDHLESLDLSGWKTDHVRYMSGTFTRLYNLKSINLSGWNTGNVRDISLMFYDCRKLNELDLSGWKTDNVRNMHGVFSNCESLKSLDLSDWDTHNVQYMTHMFYGCRDLKSLDLSGWDTSNVKDMRFMFDNCPAPYKVVDNKIVRR